MPLDDREAKTVAAQIRGQATILERYLSGELGQRGDYTVVANLRALADRVAEDDRVGEDDGGKGRPDTSGEANRLASEQWDDDE